MLQNVDSNHSITVTFSISSDDSGVSDKYKHTVTAVAGEGGSVSPSTQHVVDGQDAAVNILPDAGMAVDTITSGDQEYVNDGLN